MFVVRALALLACVPHEICNEQDEALAHSHQSISCSFPWGPGVKKKFGPNEASKVIPSLVHV